MSRISNLFTLVTTTALALGVLTVASPVRAQDHSGHGHDESVAGHSHAMSQLHGGQSTMTETHHFEVRFTGDEARIYCYDKNQKALPDLKDIHAMMMLEDRDGESTELKLTYMAPNPKQGITQGYFVAQHDFTKVKDGALKALVTLHGLEKEPIHFKTAVTAGMPVSYACPMNCVEPVQDPMSCPKCGMNMAPKKAMDEGHSGHKDHGHR